MTDGLRRWNAAVDSFFETHPVVGVAALIGTPAAVWAGLSFAGGDGAVRALALGSLFGLVLAGFWLLLGGWPPYSVGD